MRACLGYSVSFPPSAPPDSSKTRTDILLHRPLVSFTLKHNTSTALALTRLEKFLHAGPNTRGDSIIATLNDGIPRRQG